VKTPDYADPLLLSKLKPDMSAREPLTTGQRAGFITGCLVLLALFAWRPTAAARVFILLATVFYLVITVYKLALVWFSTVGHAEVGVTPAELEALSDAELPVYSVLVALYREPETIGRLVEALRSLDYPESKKDVQLLLEEDDTETRAAADMLTLPPGFRITIVPPSFPRTKPKACNIGLAQARGRYLALYDAEDRPEPDQLRKAVAAFRRVGPDVACLQAKLNFYNPRQNLLTRWFAAEYAAWFDLALPGLSTLGSIIPLGGTSNHFVTARLRELFGWDAYNVTEDCDLGIRIFRAGFRSRTLNSTTWEEACSATHYWIAQRTRWVKGYIQTYLVHMRHPWRLLRELGLGNVLTFHLLLGGLVFSLLVNPLFWLLALLWMAFRVDLLTHLFPGPVFAMGAVCLFAGNFTFVYVGAVACYKRGYYDLVKYALLAPIYWVLMSVAGWRALFQFFSNPFLWEKTRHGLYSES
jgi:cellulose synthase/poly-beta-1,6-N-acetylglucosamine synthase-like glycosyltransferase